MIQQKKLKENHVLDSWYRRKDREIASQGIFKASQVSQVPFAKTGKQRQRCWTEIRVRKVLGMLCLKHLWNRQTEISRRQLDVWF